MTIDDLFRILESSKPSIMLKEYEEQLFNFIPDLKACKGFDQNSDWHIYDVYEHTLHVVDRVDNNIISRLAALFHDIGKPYTYSVDERGNGHFYNHWVISADIFNAFAEQQNIDYTIRECVSKLIYYHDLNLLKLNNDILEEFIYSFDSEELDLLFDFKRADLLAQNPKYIRELNNIDKQEKLIRYLTHSKKVL